MPSPVRPNAFPATLRLHGSDAFKAHYDRGLRVTAGPLVALALPSTHPYTRLGLSAPKKLGKANARNRARRLLREAFRLSREKHPPNLDLVILIRPHEEKAIAEYQALLAALFRKLSAKGRNPA